MLESATIATGDFPTDIFERRVSCRHVAGLYRDSVSSYIQFHVKRVSGKRVYLIVDVFEKAKKTIKS